MNEFFVGNFRVDMLRSQIIAQDDIVSMEPKVLQVLLILAENQGQVVSHDDILNKVWPDVLVAPNALQRCVAQLRKAFHDDAKTQKVIATHPKIGYSLIADVNWQGRLPPPEIMETPSPRWRWLFGAISIGIIFLTLYQLKSQQNRLPINQLTALTTTDNKEFSPTFSPDGRYIAFQRYVGLCKNQLWAIDLTDNREYLLTKEAGIYGTPSWSPDSQQLAFSNVTQCGRERELSGCKDIRALSFVLAKSSPQYTRKLLSCDQQDYSAVVWLSNDKIAFFAKEGEQTQLMSMSLSQSDITDPSKSQPTLNALYTATGDTPYSLAYSNRLNKLAIMQHDAMRNTSMLLLDPDTGEFEKVTLNIPDKFKDNVWWSSNWHPQNNSLIAATGGSLFEIGLDGEIVEHPVPTIQGIYDPYFHPDGSRIVAAMGIFDMDIGELHWQINSTENTTINRENQVSHSQILHRSILSESDAQYQPHGDKIAFISRRSGSSQIWITQKVGLTQQNQNTTEYQAQPRQLSHLLADKSSVSSFIWSSDGKLIIYIARGKLQLINLDGQTQPLTTPFKVLDLYQQLDKHRLLLNVIHQQQVKIMSFDINSGEYRELYVGQTRWAQQAEDQLLYITDNEKVISQIVGGKKQPIANLKGLTLRAKFFYQNNQLILLGDDKYLWLYDLQAQTQKVLLETIDAFKYISDIDLDKQRLLFTKVVSARKEIVMFHE